MLYRQLGRASGRIQNQRSLPVDLLENDDSYLVVFDAPGAETDDVQVRYMDGTVKISVDRFRPFRDRYEMRFPGRGTHLSGTADLPADAVVDPSAGTATLSDTGSLRIEIPKASTLQEPAADDIELDDTRPSDGTPPGELDDTHNTTTETTATTTTDATPPPADANSSTDTTTNADPDPDPDTTTATDSQSTDIDSTPSNELALE
ncbi:heat shock protein Hsp20 [Natrialba asiatica DSM 12278]|uniref:Heat shock protein Hsp20 n=1 Tax=Natrialba asiatica (strain ATCC 700177 / DSM 12278 / JCM 9576 / FERM P-10747 / NBRC 102637 / 172P1) TaxID=29540 RepID=M0AJA8_NATA1|nr:heat shock protein Hsp20 [Natrialba asiatica DSM 12278]